MMFVKIIQVVFIFTLNLLFLMDAVATRIEILGDEVTLRDQAKPEVRNFSFETTNLNGVFTLSVYNGGRHSKFCRVSSAVIKLNDEVLFSPNDFNQKVFLLEREAHLQLKNTLSVELRGKLGCAITFDINGELYTRDQ